MQNILKSKSILFMKVGNHANESFEQILRRKRKELDAAGKIFWGYGGSACHPLTQVRPFVRYAIEQGETPILVMQSISSNMDQGEYAAEEYSEDGVNWLPIPKGVRVTGSRYAMILGEIQPGDFMLDPREFEVGIGPSRGKRADEYLQGRTDKACLTLSERRPHRPAEEDELKKISFFGKLVDPYAVMLR
jgi:hypothetical protein